MTGTELEPYAAVGSALAVTDGGAITGLILPEDTSEETLQSIFAGMNALESTKAWVVGDAAAFYKVHYPTTFLAALEPLTELDKKTVLVYAAVCRAFPDLDFRARYIVPQTPEERAASPRRTLTFSHFSGVKRYGPETAAYWLERAALEDLSLTQMDTMLEEGPPGSDVPPPVPEVPACQPGILYALGPHRLICGDATDPAVINALFAEGETATMMWTDPPYGVNYTGKTAEALKIQNDSRGSTALLALLIDAWRAIEPHLIESAPFYVAGPTDRMADTFIRSFQEVEWRYLQMLIWVKNTMVLGHSDYQLKHEAVYYGYAPGRRTGRIAQMEESTWNQSGDIPVRWHGPNNATSILEAAKPPASTVHPTMKPVKLIVPGIDNSSLSGDIVLDPFAGSGSTMIAAEQTGRRAFMVEYDARYADAIVSRWAQYQAEQALSAQPEPSAYPDIEGTATISEDA